MTCANYRLELSATIDAQDQLKEERIEMPFWNDENIKHSKGALLGTVTQR